MERKDRDYGIDLLKFFAVLLITNSHMDCMYPIKELGTGGAIGDAFFFYCSGFTIFRKDYDNFLEYYKRRINRIYPIVISWAIYKVLLFDYNDNIIYTILHGGKWFVSCIMIYYVLLYIIKKYFRNNLKSCFAICFAGILIWYFFLFDRDVFLFETNVLIGWGYFFLFMLLGAINGLGKDLSKFKSSFYLSVTILSIVSFYGLLIVSSRYVFLRDLQILSLIPLLICCNSTYQFLSSVSRCRFLNYKYVYPLIMFVSGLCLEIYLVQGEFITDKLNHIFPVNILLVGLSILIMAYIVKVTSRIFEYIFDSSKKFDLKQILKLY